MWSDFKNNTKRKAARIHKAAIGTGGGPALRIQLTELENRLLNIIGTQAATGLVAVTEAGLSQVLMKLYCFQIIHRYFCRIIRLKICYYF